MSFCEVVPSPPVDKIKVKLATLNHLFLFINQINDLNIVTSAAADCVQLAAEVWCQETV